MKYLLSAPQDSIDVNNVAIHAVSQVSMSSAELAVFCFLCVLIVLFIYLLACLLILREVPTIVDLVGPELTETPAFGSCVLRLHM